MGVELDFANNSNNVDDATPNLDELILSPSVGEAETPAETEQEDERTSDSPFEKKKRKRTLKVWDEFREVSLVDGSKKAECIYCKAKLSMNKSGFTTQYKRHLDSCVQMLIALRGQNVDCFELGKSKLDAYLEDRCVSHKEGIDPPFDTLRCWRENSNKYKILSLMACDILAIPITTVVSESAFSAGGRVIDPYRASLCIDTVQVLTCGADWIRSFYGIKRKAKMIDENDEKLLEVFFNTDARPQRTLADVIAAKLRENDSAPKLDKSVIELYKGLGEFLSKYTAGKVPKTFKHIPAMTVWEDVLHLTEPEKWSPNAMYQATRIFASNLTLTKASRFCKLVLLPRIRDDIKKHKWLHFALYESLKKALYKPAAFNKGILLPLCQSGTCSLREAVIVGSILQKASIPMLHSGVTLLKLAEMEYCGTTSYFIKLLFEKKYALPYLVVDAVVAHFMRFLEDTRTMPVIWHQSLLAFVQKYKNELRKVDKDNLRTLVKKQKHGLVTPEILRELDEPQSWREGRSNVDKYSVINNAIEEDRFDIPDVPMED